MHLKRLELQGYKSFAARTELEFNSGITTIVGPNGSGKSNVADALRWVLGEPSFRVLRAKRTEDMIYAGGARRARMGMAQVRLTLDNGHGQLPVDYSEVTITRRAYRSGENEYYLNGTQVRRRDLVEVLAGAGLHRNGYAVIGQGRVDAVLSLGPKERRQLLDEAAGIDLYQAKRDDALARLDETLSNLTRVNDIINEITPRLTRLERRAQRAREHVRLSRELEGLLRTWYGYQWQQAQDLLAAAEAMQEQHQAALEAQRSQLQELHRRLEGLRIEREELHDRLDRWQEERDRLRGRQALLGQKMAAAQERTNTVTARGEELGQELSELEARKRTVNAEVVQTRADYDRAVTRHRELETQLADAELTLASVAEKTADLKEALQAAESEALKLATAVAEVRSRRSQIAERLAEVEGERANEQRAIAQLQAQMRPLQAELERRRRDAEAAAAAVRKLEAEEAQLAADALAGAKRISELEHDLARAKARLESLLARQEVLAQWQTARNGYQAGTRAVLTNPDLRGVIGTLADLIIVPPELERAVEAALGDALQTIVVEQTAHVRAAIAWLESAGNGRAAFLPLDRARSKALRRPPPQKALGVASDLVSFEPQYAPAVEALLGDVVVLPDLSAAYPTEDALDGYRVVTLAGEVVEPSGVVIGGRAGEQGGILAASRERREMPVRITGAEEAVAGLVATLEDARAQKARVEQHLETIRHQRSALQRTRQEALEDASSHRQRLDRLTHEIEWREGNVSRRSAERQSLENKAQVLDTKLDGAQAAHEAVAGQATHLRVQLDAEEIKTAQAAVAELRTALAVARSEMSNRHQQAVALKERSARLKADLDARREKVAALEREKVSLQEQIAALDGDMASVSQQIDELRDSAAPARARLDEIEVGQQQLEAAERAGQDQLREEQERTNQAMLGTQRCRDRLVTLQQQIEADLGLTALDTDLPDRLPRQLPLAAEGGEPVHLPAVTEIPADLQQRIQGLRARLRGLGPMDADADAEYQEVLERHHFLSGQAEDLHQAVEDLRRLIADLDQAMEQRFQATFATAAEAFRAYFTRLFNGGSAELVLTDPDDFAGTGVEVMARPPGKRTQPLALLSGGERALTAVALLFALLKASPTPFCLLDEVDAMLDEANTGRFRQTLAELSQETQFILITHNRGTVEIAESVYGVTMNDDGVSQVLSLKLDEAIE